MAELVPTAISNKCVAIVKFGPAGFPTDGFKAGEYYQVTLDPNLVSKSGDFIRLGTYPGDEIMGWQRAMALTVVEVLAEFDGAEPPPIVTGHDEVLMNFLKD